MTIVATNELSGLALDLAAAKAEYTDGRWIGVLHGHSIGVETSPGSCIQFVFRPTTDWAHGGPIIERERIEVTPPVSLTDSDQDWMATDIDDSGIGHLTTGPTPLIAAMRCFVASKLGDKIDVPKEIA